jgi:hypothetical protein
MRSTRTAVTDPLPRVAHVLRAAAVLIALLGVVDPAITRTRRGTPTVAVVRADTLRHKRAFDAVRARLRAAGVQVTNAAGAHDAARVVVGAALPASLDEDTTRAVPTSVYAPATASITQLSMPARTVLSAPTVVSVDVWARNAGALTVQLVERGTVVSTITLDVRAGARSTVVLPYTPTHAGEHALTAQVLTDAARADTVRLTRALLVDSLPWRVLAWDARPSYLATFVRRALARDPRFVVKSRVVTTRAPSATVTRGTANVPASLAAVDPHGVDVLLLGAPDALTATDVNAVQRLVREDGLPVVLLADQTGGALLRSLTGVDAWSAVPRRDAVSLASATDSAALRALAFASPVRLPRDAESLVQRGNAVVLWRQPVGRGEVLVSTAFDAWRFRDAGQSAFDITWRERVAEAADRRPPAVTFTPAAAVVAPDERLPLTVNSSARPTLVRIDSAGVEHPLPVFATASNDAWVTVVPPVAIASATGSATARLVARAGRDSAVMPLVVDPQAGRDLDDAPEVVRAWAESRDGRVVGTLDSLVTGVLAAQRAAPQPLPWHPMRSPWWIVPFTLALGGDWWLRRRNGRA